MLNTICRLCCKTEGVISIFYSSSELTPSQKLIYCFNKTKINIEEDDDFSKLICVLCNEQLCKTYNFILQCEAADKKLHSESKYDDYEYGECLNVSYEFKEENYSEKEEVKCAISLNTELPIDDSNHIIVKQEDQAIELKPKTVNKKNNPNKIKKKHKKVSTNPEPFICSTCNKECQNNSLLLAHMRSHSDKRAFKCLHCDKTYKDPSGLKRHNDNNHTERSRDFVCDNCGKCFYTQKYLVIHMRTHTGETPYACKLCPAKFSQLTTLIIHNRRHTGERPFQCTICKKKFCSKAELQKHTYVHSQERQFKCTLCNMEYKHKGNYRLHMAQHISKPIFVCDFCNRSFGAKSYLALHIKRRHSDESGYCEICCKHMTNIEVHMGKHYGYRGMKCDYCPEAFFDKKGLAHHVVYRHNNKQYICTENHCEASFPVKSMLNNHISKVHNPVIPFPCDRCARGFYRKSDYARHKKQTHKELL